MTLSQRPPQRMPRLTIRGVRDRDLPFSPLRLGGRILRGTDP